MPVNTSENKKKFLAGDVIMRQGTQGDCAYVIEHGKVEILIEKDGDRVFRVGTRGEGSIVGEMAMIDDAPRTATVRALEDCEMLEISREDFSRRLTGSDPVVQMFTQVILMRYRDMLMRAEILHDAGVNPPAEELEKEYSLQSGAFESIKIANELKDALRNDELELYYQPIVDLSTGLPRGFEALMRWNHPERGRISPALFIPVAEDTGLIVEASNWALREACRALTRIEGQCGGNDLYMSVNFSSTDFAADNFVEGVYETLSMTDVPAEKIKLEITERLLMGQPENAKETLRLCRKAGMGIAIDDFGTGYSSLSYLHYFPINTLKIDRSFIADMLEEEGSVSLVESIVQLARNMKMTVVAEGVENRSQALKLKELGCDQGQGYLFARPCREKDLIEMLRNWTPFS